MRIAISPAVAVIAVLALAGTADAATAVGPDQHFLGVVNGSTGNATFTVVCPGPVGTVGHPFNDNVEVVLESLPPASAGYTGSTANSIEAVLEVGTSVQEIGTLTSYGTLLDVPSSLTVPCGGTGTVAFLPTPDTKHDAIPATRIGGGGSGRHRRRPARVTRKPDGLESFSGRDTHHCRHIRTHFGVPCCGNEHSTCRLVGGCSGRVATPFAAGVASAVPPHLTSIHVIGSGSTPDATKADAAQKLQVAGQFSVLCYPPTFGAATQSGNSWQVSGTEVCVDR